MGLHAVAAEDFQFVRDDFAHRNDRRTLLCQHQPDLEVFAVLAQTDQPLEEVTPLYIAKHRLHSGKQVLTVRTAERPGIAALDPYHKRIERSAGNNSLKIAALPITVSRLSP
jgi:Tfp pilus assembly protein PilN